MGTCILPGARIGDGCIVGAGSVVVAGELEANTIAVGNPARVIKRR
jgi:acetyltransferase-like isoleucine patch superfamily enzyme